RHGPADGGGRGRLRRGRSRDRRGRGCGVGGVRRRAYPTPAGAAVAAGLGHLRGDPGQPDARARPGSGLTRATVRREPRATGGRSRPGPDRPSRGARRPVIAIPTATAGPAASGPVPFDQSVSVARSVTPSIRLFVPISRLLPL